MRHILVPLNHRPSSLGAILAAARIADAFEAVRIELAYVKEPDHAVAADAQLYEARDLLEGAGYKMQFMRLEGRIADRIVEFAATADLVVMRNPQPRADGAPLSPVTAEVVRRCPRPVVVVGEAVTEFTNPLFAYNGSPQSRRALATALTLLAPVLTQRGTVIVVTSDEHMAERLLGEALTMGQQAGVALTPCWSAGRPADLIIDKLGADGHDGLVMGAYGRSWLRERVFGSTTTRVVRECTPPLWMSC